MSRGATEFKMNMANYSLNFLAILEKSEKGIQLGKKCCKYVWVLKRMSVISWATDCIRCISWHKVRGKYSKYLKQNELWCRTFNSLCCTNIMCALGYPVNNRLPIFLKRSDVGPMEDIPTASAPVISHLKFHSAAWLDCNVRRWIMEIECFLFSSPINKTTWKSPSGKKKFQTISFLNITLWRWLILNAPSFREPWYLYRLLVMSIKQQLKCIFFLA